jgi:hypothetical protein
MANRHTRATSSDMVTGLVRLWIGSSERGLRQGKTMEQIWESINASASRPGGQDIIPQLLGQ